jgi:hypothetical protein
MFKLLDRIMAVVVGCVAMVLTGIISLYESLTIKNEK